MYFAKQYKAETQWNFEQNEKIEVNSRYCNIVIGLSTEKLKKIVHWFFHSPKNVTVNNKNWILISAEWVILSILVQFNRITEDENK